PIHVLPVEPAAQAAAKPVTPSRQKPAPPPAPSLGWALAGLALFLAVIVGIGVFAAVWVAVHLAAPSPPVFVPTKSVQRELREDLAAKDRFGALVPFQEKELWPQARPDWEKNALKDREKVGGPGFK